MNLEYTRGCMAWSLTADGTEEVDMTDEQRTEVKKKICEWIKKEADLNELMQLLVVHYSDEYESDNESCECCGDYVETYKWRI